MNLEIKKNNQLLDILLLLNVRGEKNIYWRLNLIEKFNDQILCYSLKIDKTSRLFYDIITEI